MKRQFIHKIVLISAIALSRTQPALAVSDEEFNALKEQFNQLADQVDENSQNSGSSTTVGGYGELHYNNLSNGAGTDKKVLDLHRFVIFVNHEFNDDIRFFSEFEIEHAFISDNNDADGTDGTSPGEIEVEQAFIQFDIGENSKIDAGVFLIPVGILNETHEPPTFYGVERNPVEKNIIPVTWWEGGTMLSGHYDSGISYDLALTSGLSVEADQANKNYLLPRSGRQKTANSKANNLAATARLKYTGVRGLELAGTVQVQDDMTQDSSDNIDGATLVEAHARWNIADFTLTGLYGRWDIDGADALAAQKDIQDGAYIEASYKIHPKFGIFVRQNEWNNGGAGDTSESQTDVGFNYWPHENVVIKADYQAQNDIAGNFDGFNLGLGYQF